MGESDERMITGEERDTAGGECAGPRAGVEPGAGAGPGAGTGPEAGGAPATGAPNAVQDRQQALEGQQERKRRGTRAGWRVQQAKKLEILAALQERTADIISRKSFWRRGSRGGWRGRQDRQGHRGQGAA